MNHFIKKVSVSLMALMMATMTAPAGTNAAKNKFYLPKDVLKAKPVKSLME